MPVKTAIIHDALPFYGGAERTLTVMLDVLPDAEIFTLVHNAARLVGTPLDGARIHSTWLDRLPGIRSNHYRFFPLFPLALRAFDLSPFDLVISSHYAAAGWVRTRPDQTHLAYIHTPLRYLWHDVPALPVPRPFLNLLRRIDRTAMRRIDRFAANSKWTADAVARAYGRDAEVIYPPVRTSGFPSAARIRTGFLCVSRLAVHKQLETVIRAFNTNGQPLMIVGDGPERARLEALAGPSVQFTGWIDDAHRDRLLTGARAFIHMAPEDFGIGVVEAQAAGCPVIAFDGGANRETVRDGKTGLLVPEQTPESLNRVIEKFVEMEGNLDPARLRAHAAQFDEAIFRQRFAEFVARAD